MKLRTRKLQDGSTSFFIDLRQNGQRRRVRLTGIQDRKTAEIAFADFKVRHAKGQAGLPTNEALTLGQALKAYLAAKRGEGCVARHYTVLAARARQAEAYFGAGLPVKNLSAFSITATRWAGTWNEWQAYLQTPDGKQATREACWKEIQESDLLQDLERE